MRGLDMKVPFYKYESGREAYSNVSHVSKSGNFALAVI